MALFSKAVDCGCPDSFVLGVLDTLPGDIRMSVCMRCGKSDLADPIVSEDRPHDVQFHGYRLIELSSESRVWASAWPSFAEAENRRVYLAPYLRFETESELKAAVASAALDQRTAALRETLITLGVPQWPPPEDLPDELNGFAEIWHGLRLNDATPIDELLDAATRFNGPSRLATEILARRPDLELLAKSWIGDAVSDRRSWGYFLVRQFLLTGPAVLAALGERIAALAHNRSGELTEICGVLYRLGAAGVPVRPEVEAAIPRFAPNDYYAHQDLLRILKMWDSLR